MKTKKFLIALLLVSFCGPQTQAEICEEYKYRADYELEKLENNIMDLNYSFIAFNENELSEGVMYAKIQEQIDNIDDQIETFSNLIPNDTNLYRHNQLLTNLEVIKNGLKGFLKWVSNNGTPEEFSSSSDVWSEGINEVFSIVKVYWECPTD
jgi:hypothetical protein